MDDLYNLLCRWCWLRSMSLLFLPSCSLLDELNSVAVGSSQVEVTAASRHSGVSWRKKVMTNGSISYFLPENKRIWWDCVEQEGVALYWQSAEALLIVPASGFSQQEEEQGPNLSSSSTADEDTLETPCGALFMPYFSFLQQQKTLFFLQLGGMRPGWTWSVAVCS